MHPLRERLGRAAAVMRRTPFDKSTPEGRSQERNRRIALTAVAAAVARGTNILTALISVPLTISYLGAERYGLWMAIISATAVLGFADLGMGNGLLNAVSEANGKDDPTMARRYISSAFSMLCLVACSLAIGFWIIYPWVPWSKVFNVSSPQAMAEAGPTMAVFAASFLINLPLGVVQRVRLGYQEGFSNSVWGAIGGLLGLAGMLTAIHLQAGLPWLVLAITAGPIVATVLNGVTLFGFQRPEMRPRWTSALDTTSRSLFNLGIGFLVLQVAAVLTTTSDNIVVAHVLGLNAVAEYAVAVKLFTVVSMILGFVLRPLWPAYAESIARGDIDWLKRTLARTLLIALWLVGSTSLLLVVFGKPIIRWWVGAEMAPPLALLFGLAVFSVISALGNSVAVFLNAARIIRFQVVTALLMGVGSLVAKIYLGGQLGLPGIIWGTIMASVLFSGIPLLFYVPKVLARLEERPHLAGSHA
jgi:O-antigen/teichoic acid export membrane protein